MKVRFAALVCCALAAGCVSLEPAYHRPTPPIPARFPAGPAYPAPAVESASIAGWRDFFADAKLKAVIEEALANNRDLRAAVANVAIAKAQWRVQRAALFPTVQAQGGMVLGRFPTGAAPTTGAGGSGASSPPTVITGNHFNEQEFSAEFVVPNYELDLFGQVRSMTKAAFEQYLASAQARKAAQIALVAQVATAYVTLGSDRTLLAVASDTLKNGESSLSLNQERFSHGVASGSDVAQASQIADQARFDVGRLTAQCAQDRNALELLVGAPVADDLLPGAVLDQVTVLPDLPAGVRSDVLLARPDVLQAEDQLKGANANIGAARAAFFPAITLTGAGGLMSDALAQLFTGPAATWTFAPQITQTLFDAGKNRGNLAVAKATRDLDQAQYEKAVQTAFREVADALAQRGTIQAQLAAEKALVADAAEDLRLASARYARGADTFLNVLIAQRTLYTAQQTLTTTRLLQTTNLIALYQALGGGLS